MHKYLGMWLKVLLDDGQDIRRMQHHGFEIGVGSNILAEMSYRETVLSEAPYGTCGKQPLDHFSDDPYTYNKCTQDCYIRNSLETCSCVESYREVRVQESNHSCGVCVSECDSVDFITELSSSTLSSAVFDQIPHKLQDFLAQEHNDVASLRYRLSPEKMHEVIDFMTNISDSIQQLQRIGNVKLYGSETSILMRIEKAVGEIKKKIDFDLVEFYKKVENQSDNYEKYVQPVTDSYLGYLKTALTDLQSALAIDIDSPECTRESYCSIPISEWRDNLRPQLLHAINGFIRVKKFEKLTEFFFKALYHSSWTEKMLNNTVRYPGRPKDLRIISERKDDWHCLSYLWGIKISWPMSELDNDHWRDTKEWIKKNNHTVILENSQYASEVRLAFTENSNESSVMINFAGYDTMRQEWQNVSTQLMERIQHLDSCFSGYITSINKILDSRKDRSVMNINETLSTYDSDDLNHFKSLLRVFRGLKTNYAQNNLTIFALAKEIDKFYADIRDAVESLQALLTTRLVQPVDHHLGQTARDVISMYMSLFDDCFSLGLFTLDNAEDYIKHINESFIWKDPVVDMFGREVGLLKFTKSEEKVQILFRHGLQAFLNGIGPNIMKKNVERLFTGIRHELQVVFTKFWSVGNSLVSDVGAFNDYLIKFSTENDPEKIIIRDNMVNLNIYYKDLNCRKVRQKPAYDILAFFSDFGGYMGLLLGASVVSIIELLDWCLYRCLFQRKIQSLISTVQVRSRAIYPHSEVNDRVLSRMSNVCMAKESTKNAP
ncbi:hypothetical protein CAPTEDRAFT_194981 [Capitella teleta]|uniref:Uncharacterized protein n=1 Tax=Capitella teleta TaxID=283909 RepID=R7VGZ8_CAPTE|nr:hypothetical protein CAPTEDRAFT_194981 [Capitella teleta]|eukprot:ELU17842.1 hypothetical protein CAPTEDRAFT_194981 [Capitella teleta]